jgi:hypothetical protein
VDRQSRNGKRPKKKGSTSLCSTGLSPHVVWLRETHENSNYILLRIPIEISNSAHGEKAFSIAEAPLSSILPLSPAAITQLQDVRLIRLPRSVRAKKLPIDYAALQQTYRLMFAEGEFASQAELAGELGVSRVWVNRVLKGIKRKPGSCWSLAAESACESFRPPHSSPP